MNPQQKSSPGSKFLLSFGLILVSTIYAVWQSFGAGERSTTTTTPSTNQQPTSIQITPSQSYQAANQALQQTLANIGASTTPTSAPTATTPTPSMMGGSMMRSGLYADGIYTGSVADAYYGMVQVKAIIKNGKITDVQFLQYPSDRGTSREINGQAMPLLTQEAIQVQSANVSGVSGATETSRAFVQSLASALALAKN